MFSGKDAFRHLLLLLLGLACVGCVGNGSRRQVVQQPAPRGSGGPVAVEEPRPVNPSPPALPASATQDPLPPEKSPGTPPGIPVSTQTTVPPADPLAHVRRLHQAAVQRYATMNDYKARVRRQEQLNGKMNPEETLEFNFRKQPWSVHFKWLSNPGKDREVLYVKGQHGNNLHTRLAEGDGWPVYKAGARIALPPNDPQVLKRSRYPITDAGLGAIIDRLGVALAALDRGDVRGGTLTYLGPKDRGDYATAKGEPCSMEALEHVLPPGAEPTLPRGGRRVVHFDPVHGLPVLVETKDEKGQLVEYYCFDRLMINVKLDDDDFNPDKLWKKP